MTRPWKSLSGLTRRQLLGAAVAGGSAATGLLSSRVWSSAGHEPYEGPLLVTLQLDGGVDVTQLCDPKVNVKGEPKINYWADAADTGQAGNLLYAPVANNAAFFERYGRDMLVINGVDSQTNSHETGKLYNWTGSNAEGRPSCRRCSLPHSLQSSPLPTRCLMAFPEQQGSLVITVLMTFPIWARS